MSIQFAWPPAAVEILRTRAEGGATYATIAVEINKMFGSALGRSAISGKANRMGLAKPASVARKSTKRKSPEEMVRIFQGASGQRVMVEIPAPREVRIEGGVGLLELRESYCRWPLWGHDERPEEPRYCGTMIDPAHTYCGQHRALAYMPRVRRAPVSDETRQAQRVAQLRRWAKEKGQRA